MVDDLLSLLQALKKPYLSSNLIEQEKRYFFNSKFFSLEKE
jgi:hypothetical protein